MAKVETVEALREIIGRESIREFDQAVAGRYKTDL